MADRGTLAKPIVRGASYEIRIEIYKDKAAGTRWGTDLDGYSVKSELLESGASDRVPLVATLDSSNEFALVRLSETITSAMTETGGSATVEIDAFIRKAGVANTTKRILSACVEVQDNITRSPNS